MKKLIYCMAALGALIFAASCAEDGLDVTGKTTEVTFSVAAPSSIQSKANTDANGESTIANGLNTDILFYEIYDNNDGTEKLLGEGQEFGNVNDGKMTFEFTLDLVIDQEYHILFWAHDSKNGKKYYNVTDLRKIKIEDNYEGFLANDESRAAFYAYHPFKATVDGGLQEVKLTRPFAQLNIGTDRLESSLTDPIIVKTTTVTISNVANVFNTFTGEGSLDLEEGETELAATFEAAPTPHGEDVDNKQTLLNVKDTDYYWLGMNYILVKGVQDTADEVSMEIVTNAGTVNHTVPTVPLRQNYRTNLIGNLLTTGVEFNVVVDKLFESDRDGATEKDYIWDYSTQSWNKTN